MVGVKIGLDLVRSDCSNCAVTEVTATAVIAANLSVMNDKLLMGDIE